MTTRMLIDARHPEETRVAVLTGNRIEEFDFDSADHKQIKGNIYLAKVTRVEPSLQAAFVDFGGNRHGFLAFSEIHPDYYQIPKEDREALLAEEAAHAAEEAALRAAEEAEEDADTDSDDAYGHDAYGTDGDDPDDTGNGSVTEIDTSEKDQVATIEGGQLEQGFDSDTDVAGDEADGDQIEGDGAEDHAAGDDDEGHAGSEPRAARGRGRRQGRAQAKDGRGAADDLRSRRMALRRRYKIQDVIQRRQVLLVQVVKEERGNKGAALTTYLSLAGRYCVLMPNSTHGGGISRKINSVADRKRLKSIVADMGLPKTMGCIVRTAGLQRTQTEIRRDFDYLARLWDDIRETTLHSSAPALIHSDSDLIKRAIRDIYNRDIEEVIVEGEAGYRLARDFMKLLMPGHARRIKAYADPVPLFQRFGAEDQLTAMYDPVVQLRSGGYIVINPTEALVSIDINSGRSTKEHGIEATAVNTNLEAAREIARQLRLRDMAGLVVIDFIDMEYSSNIRKVEKAMKDALKDDRARIQIGRISGFGLMEMSRQRLRTGVLEATTRACPHCDGSGLVRTAGSAGLSALRMIEEEAGKGRGIVITLFASQEATIYVLNTKRADLAAIEARYGVSVEVIPEGENEGAKMRVASSGPRNEFLPRVEAVAYIEEDDDDLPEEEDDALDDEPATRERADDGELGSDAEGSGDGRRKRRKRRRGRGRDDDQAAPAGGDEADADADENAPAAEGEASPDESDAADASDSDAQAKRRRRGRRRRGGRHRDEPATDQPEGADARPDEAAPAEPQEAEPPLEPVAPLPAMAEPSDAAAEDAPAPRKRARRKPTEAAPVSDTPTGGALENQDTAAAPAPKRASRKKATGDSPATAVADDATAEAPAKRRARKKPDTAAAPAEDEAAQATAPEPEPTPSTQAIAALGEAGQADAASPDETDGTPRRGWWQRTFGT